MHARVRVHTNVATTTLFYKILTNNYIINLIINK